MSMTVSCPGCHAKHRFRDDVAIDKTVYVKCPACDHVMMISPQNPSPAPVMPRPEARSTAAREARPAATQTTASDPAGLPPDVLRAMAASRQALFRLERVEFYGQSFSEEEITKLISTGEVTGGDLIAHLGVNDWKPIADLPQFVATVTQRESQVASREHPTDTTRDVRQSRTMEVPIPKALAKVFWYPLGGRGKIGILICILFIILAMLSSASVPLLVFDLAYALAIVRESSDGEELAPGWEAFADVLTLFSRSLQLLLVTIVCAFPLLLFNLSIALLPVGKTFLKTGSTLGEGLFLEPLIGFISRWRTPTLLINLLLVLAVMSYYPMSIALLAVRSRLATALHPARIVSCIKALGRPYRIAVTMGTGLLAAASIASYLLIRIAADGDVSAAGAIPAIVLTTYCTFIFLHLVGRAVHSGRGAFNP